ncbi:MAG TPA: hypothetical protein VMH38_01405 [Thermoplasmata archaeon]|nr:hypothetical protein [Thermoplasmata archaeon]
MGRLRSILVQGELSPTDLEAAFSGGGAEGQASTSYAFGSVKVLMIVGRKFYFRTNDQLGAVLLATSNGQTQRIDISYAGGGSGLLGIQMGAGNDLEGNLFDSVVNTVQSRSLSCQEVSAL